MPKFYYYFKIKSKQNLSIEIENFLANLIPSNKSPVHSDFIKKWPIDLLLPLLFKFARLVQNVSWAEPRAQIISDILLPLARKAAVSHDWLLRFYAAESFGLMFEIQDEKYILKLVADEVRLVYLSALTAAIEFGSEEAVNIIITRMSKEPKLSQTTYLTSFDNVPARTQFIIIKRLLSTSDTNIRETCYRILLKYPPIKITWNMTSDITSKSMALQIVAIRFLTHVVDESAISILIELLKQESWQVKAVCIHSLSNLGAYQAFDNIVECLQDKEWWVRLIAAQALKSFGTKGEKVLQSRGIEVDATMINVTQYVLNNL